MSTLVAVRPYRHEDEDAVLALLRASLGSGPVGHRPPEFFRWKHFENPFGSSFILVAEAEDMIIGLRAFMRWKLRVGDRVLSAVRAVDTATHPHFQGMGIFSRLTLAALDGLRGEVDLVFNTPNEKSGPGYLKMGWIRVGQMPVSIRVRRPIRFVRGLRSIYGKGGTPGARPQVGASSAAELLSDNDAIADLLERARPDGHRLATDRSVQYLRWRYGTAPLLDYRAIGYSANGHLRGLAVFRVRSRGRLWELTVAEMIAPDADDRTRRELLKEVALAAPTDYVTYRSAVDRHPSGWRGWLRAGGITFMVNPLKKSLSPDPVDLRSWALTLGDLEVF